MAYTDEPLTLPTEVRLTKETISNPRFTPRELQMILAATGKTFTSHITDETGDEKYTVLAWLLLRRDGLEVAYDDMLDIVLTLDWTDATVDPTLAPPAETSLDSAGTGA